MELDTRSLGMPEPRTSSFDCARWSDFLPDKLWTQILRNLSSRDVCVLAQVDKKFSALCSDETVWQSLFIGQFAKTYADSRITSIAASRRSWKHLCKGGSLPPVAESSSDLPVGSVATPQQLPLVALQSSPSHEPIPPVPCCSAVASSCSVPSLVPPPTPSRCAPSLRALASSQLPLRKRFKGCGDYAFATASPVSASASLDSSSSDSGASLSSSGGALHSSWGTPAHSDLPPRKAHKLGLLTRDVKSPTPPPDALTTSPPQQPAAQPVRAASPLPVLSPMASPLPPVLKPSGNGSHGSQQPKKRVQIAAPVKKAAGKVKQRPVDSVGEPLYCFCRRRYDPKVFMIACDLCDEWYHGACVGITEQEASRVASYVCPSCRGENNPVATSAPTHSAGSDSEGADDAFDASFRSVGGTRKKRKGGNLLPKRPAA